MGKVYRHIHVELEKAMGGKPHSEHYNNYPKVIEQIRTFLKNARTKIKILRLREKEIDEEKRVLDKLSEEEKVLKAKKESEGKMRDSLRIEEQVFQDKLRSEIENFEFEEINEIQETCNKFHILLEEYYNLLSRVKITFTDDYENEFKVVFETTIAKIRDQIKEGKLKIRELNSVIKTAIYGVRPSGNLAECGLRKTAELTQSECPKAYDIIMNDMYVDDCMSGDDSFDETLQVTEQLSVALAKGGFSLKGFTFSGKAPPEHLSNDG